MVMQACKKCKCFEHCDISCPIKEVIVSKEKLMEVRGNEESF